jgi:hypothetical protein
LGDPHIVLYVHVQCTVPLARIEVKLDFTPGFLPQITSPDFWNLPKEVRWKL